ncbi:predicted protein [Cyanophage P-SSP2]|uniref:Uncharacterized protein n=1 Tax=Cyanophage P-SSP2 TaxID=444876 RepID=E3SQJ4_9CAUD|nr:hypothetical protein CYLG_00009 [Cyanophage P-SSP2]ADP00212.1 predicted protein [Cyanophage P-SSP2]
MATTVNGVNGVNGKNGTNGTKKLLEEIYKEFPIYKGLEPTTKIKSEFKQIYKTIQDRLISDGSFPNKQARGLNLAVLTEMGEFPYWAHKGKDPVALGEGVVHKMSGGEARPAFLRNASNAKADSIRLQRTNWANDLMSAAGFGDEVKEGSGLFSAKNRVGGKAWDHTYELQDFGPRYKSILKKFASGSIDTAKFKELVSREISKNPGDIKRNLKLLDESDNYAKRARVEADVKEFKKAEAYKVRDAKYTEFQKLDDVTKAAKIDEAHKTAVNLAGDLYIDDITENSKLFSPNINTKKFIKYGVGGLLPSVAGGAFNVLEADARAQQYKETGHWLDGVQSQISNLELMTGFHPISDAFVSTPLAVGNLFIDAARFERTKPYSYADRKRYRHGVR